ncbi:MAG: hypothetical protein LBC41_06090 [Clostridiales bacterium]|nr:hypothetical protein [Clostridiales bacterium]
MAYGAQKPEISRLICVSLEPCGWMFQTPLEQKAAILNPSSPLPNLNALGPRLFCLGPKGFESVTPALRRAPKGAAASVPRPQGLPIASPQALLAG